MTDRERADRQLGMYIAVGLVIGGLIGALLVVLFGAEVYWIAIGAGAGLIVATALALGLEPDEG